MKIYLMRTQHTKLGTLGETVVDGHPLFTLERPWLNNQQMVSCVPTGDYQLVPHTSEKFGRTWALVNPALHVVHEPGDVPAGATGWRTAILVHPANWPFELEGCIALGTGRATTEKNGQTWPMVTHSRDAFTTFRDTLVVGTTGHMLCIRETGELP
jgi:hypothetical protein